MRKTTEPATTIPLEGGHGKLHYRPGRRRELMIEGTLHATPERVCAALRRLSAIVGPFDCDTGAAMVNESWPFTCRDEDVRDDLVTALVTPKLRK